MAVLVICEGVNAAGHTDGGIKGTFGNVDANNNRLRHVPYLPSLQIRPRVRVEQLFGLVKERS